MEAASLGCLKKGGVAVWLVSLAGEADSRYFCGGLLSPSERERAARFRDETARRHFEVCRALLRLLVAAYLGARPHELEFAQDDFGRPGLRGRLAEKADGLQFSVSHSGGFGAVALSLAPSLGIDLEVHRELADARGVAAMVFTPREQALLDSSSALEWRRRFFELWVAKESFLKATGRGFSLGPESVELSFNPRPALATIPAEFGAANEWSLAGWNIASNCSLALCVRGVLEEIAVYAIEPVEAEAYQGTLPFRYDRLRFADLLGFVG